MKDCDPTSKQIRCRIRRHTFIRGNHFSFHYTSQTRPAEVNPRTNMEPAHLRRHTQRGTYDIESAKAIFDDCFVAHVSYVDNGLPQCLPMIALVTKEEDDEAASSSDNEQDGANGVDEKRENTVVYLHGHPSTRIVELVREASRETDEIDKAVEPLNPVKVCITATKGQCTYLQPPCNHC